MRVLLIFLLLGFNPTIWAQDYARKPVTVKQGTYTWKQLFQHMSSQTGVVFSYTSLDVNRKKTVNWQQKPLKSALEELFAGTGVNYRFKSKYIILTAGQEAKAPKTTMLLRGRVFSLPDSVPLARASIYLRETKQVCHTDEAGKFQMQVPAQHQQLYLQVAREGYQDTALVYQTGQTAINVYMSAKVQMVKVEVKPVDTSFSSQPAQPAEVQVPEKSLFKLKFLDRFNDLSLRNIKDTFFTNVSVSLFPPISTNKLLSIHTVNRFAFNIFSGYSKGIDGFEFGGLVNIDNGSVRYGQIAGLSNFVYGDFTGIQVGGLSNLVRDDFFGLQIGGITNLIGGQLRGCQIGGIYNRSRGVTGFQIAGLLNDADRVDGAQLSGLVNVAGRVRGVQIGLINISDSLQGVALGLFTFVRSGYHKVEVSSDERGQYNIAFRTGTNGLHQIYQVTSDFKTPVYQPGFGLGTAIRLHKSKKWYLGFETTASGVVDPSGHLTSRQAIGRVFLGLEYRPVKWFNIFAGPGINALIYDAAVSPESVVAVPSSAQLINDDPNAHFRIWNNWRFGIRLF